MTGLRSFTRPRSAAAALLVGACAFVVLSWLLRYSADPATLGSIDNAVKLIQAEELRRSGFRSMAISYPARSIDPDEQFFPLAEPFVFLSAGKWQSVFSSFHALLIAPILPHGLEWLTWMSLVSVAVATALLQLLPGVRWPVAWLALLGTPLWLYATYASEVPLALAFALAALAAGTRITGNRGDWAAGLLLGVATLLRDEMLLLGPGLLYARHLAGARGAQFVHTVAAIGLPLLAMAAVDQWWFERPMLAHLRHAVPGLDLVLPRARARLPHMEVMTWARRFETIGVFWLFGYNALVALAGTGLVALAILGRRHRWLVAGVTATFAAAHWWDVATLLAEPRVHAGLFRLSPFLLFGLLPRADGDPPTPIVRLARVVTVTVLGVVLATINTEGGKAIGPRLIMILWPLLAAAGVDTLAGYLRVWRTGPAARVIAVSGCALIAGSLIMQLAIVLPLRADRSDDDAQALRLVRAVGDRVIVNETLFDMQLTAPLYFERMIMHANPRQRTALSRALAAAGVEHFTLVLRPGAGHDPTFPDYRQVQSWIAGRFVISRWMHAARTAP
jgi:hypothetical protein